MLSFGSIRQTCLNLNLIEFGEVSNNLSDRHSTRKPTEYVKHRDACTCYAWSPKSYVRIYGNVTGVFHGMAEIFGQSYMDSLMPPFPLLRSASMRSENHSASGILNIRFSIHFKVQVFCMGYWHLRSSRCRRKPHTLFLHRPAPRVPRPSEAVRCAGALVDNHAKAGVSHPSLPQLQSTPT